MKTKTVYTPDYILLIDEDATIKHNHYLLEKGYIINIFPDYLTDLDECQKIIGYQKINLDASDLNLPLLQKLEIKLDHIYYEYCRSKPLEKVVYKDFEAGFNTAQESINNKLFTKDDMRRMAESYYMRGVRNGRMDMTKGYDLEAAFEYDLERLSQKKFIPEFEYVGECDCPCHRGSTMRHIAACCHPQKVLKIIDNQIIGSWK